LTVTRVLGVLVAIVLMLCVAAPPAPAADKIERGKKWATDNVAAECRRLHLRNSLCTAVGGIDVSERRVAEYEQSWTHRALALQRKLDDAAPFLRELLPHTHNSFNSSAYALTFTQTDPNQLYSMRDQLRMDIRAIEMDVHKWPHIEHGHLHLNDVVLCHGEPETIGPVVVHVGCSNDRPFTNGLNELRAWLAEPQNGDEVVLLYLENNLDGDAAAHNKAAQDIANVLGPLVYRPADHGAARCAPMPMDASRASLRAMGRRVLIVGNCGPGAWGDWVHERGPLWNESTSPVGSEYPDDAGCAAERSREHYDTQLIRRYEDSTALSNTVGGTGLGGPSEVTVLDTVRMVRCGVNLVGFDQLYPQDPRLPELVWSWAPGEPVAGAGACAAQRTDARFYAVGCATPEPLACVDAVGAWHVAATCPAGSRFAVPANGFENQQLRRAKELAGVGTVRVAYVDDPVTGWTPL
jgi:hypothetical protein